jgi:hypothetical protein
MAQFIQHHLLSTIVIISFLSFSCTPITSNKSNISDSLEPVDKVSLIPGGENSTLTVSHSQQSYFSFEFNNIETNGIFNNGTFEGWCIDWKIPINTETYHNIPLYNTFGVEEWKPLNYLLNIRENLLDNDPELTYKEIQVAIWILRGFPEFNLDVIPIEDLPSRLKSNGEYDFDRDKVEEIIEIVQTGHESFDFSEGTKFAVIAETPSDVQTVIAVAE